MVATRKRNIKNEHIRGCIDQNGTLDTYHMLNITCTRTEGPTYGSEIGHNQECEEKMKWYWAGHINHLKDDRWTSQLGDHAKRKDDKGDQPSSGEMIWTNARV